ncbi:MAG: BTAD domain-containing putative transcriptional regulator [Caldilineaceae bacterium]
MCVPEQTQVETLTLRTFGAVTIALQSAPVASSSAVTPNEQRLQFETRATEALLIYLACQGRPLSREVLAELFWPDRTQKQARANLRVALHRLRQKVAPYLVVTHHSVEINPDTAFALDFALFETHLAAGRLSAALALYIGDFLEGFYLDGSSTFEQWALLERERLRTLAIAAYQQLISQTAAAGQLDSAIASAQRLLQLDPLHEPSHRQLIRLLAQTGQRSAAIAQYEICCHLLSSELALSPDESTTNLAAQIRSGELDRMTRGQDDKMNASGHRIIRSSSHPLPSQPTPFIGRGAELTQIANLLANPDCRLLTLLGVGGIGKTRLAIEAAARQAADYAAEVCFVALAPVTNVELVAATIAESIGLQTNSSDLLTELANELRQRHLLLVLDNFEHLLAAVDTVAYLLQSAPTLKVLVTSRQRLYLREEWLLLINGLPLADGLASEAGALFLHSAQRIQPSFTGEGQAQAIATICRQVEGMPLALELAASWVRVLGCNAIVQQIQSNLDFLTTQLRDLPERHRSMSALFDHSWALLTPAEQQLFMRLSVFRGGWVLEEAASVTDATLTILLGLVDKSLVRVDEQKRFAMHELVRHYAAEQLHTSGEETLIRQRHYAAYLQLFRTGDSHLRGTEATTWFVRLAAEQDNLRAALQWTFDSAHYTEAAWLIVAINWFWSHHAQSYEAERWLAQLLPHRQLLEPELRLAFLIVVHAHAAGLAESAPIARYRAELLSLVESSQHPLLQVAGWVWLARYAADSVQFVYAYERAAALAQNSEESSVLDAEFGLLADHDFLLGATLSGYADYLGQQGEVARSASLAMQSLRFFLERGKRFERADALGPLGRLALLRGDLAQAHSLLQEAVAIAAAVNSKAMVRNWQPLLGLVALYRGDGPTAHRLLHESYQLCLELKNNFFLARVCIYFAEHALWEGKIDEVAQWLHQSLGYQAKSPRITIDDVQRLWVAARLATAKAQYAVAATLFGLAEQAHSQIHYCIGGPMRAQADAALAIVQAALEPAAFTEAFAAGERTVLAEAFATMLESS